MAYDPDKHRRRSVRLKEYDYSQPGAYFVTIGTQGQACLLGDIVDGEMRLNGFGEVARRCWEDIPHHFPQVVLDAGMVMPNHVHGIIVITDVCQTTCAVKMNCRRGGKSFAPTTTASTTGTAQLPSRTIGSIVRGFKIGVTKWFRANTDLHSVWQRGFYEHVIRNEAELRAIREYILSNPARWNEDENNPALLDSGR